MKKLLLILSVMFVCVTGYAEKRVRVSQSANNYVTIDKESVSGREKVCVRADHKEFNHDIVVDVAVYEINGWEETLIDTKRFVIRKYSISDEAMIGNGKNYRVSIVSAELK
ncbi:MAG: hypothetical protein J6K38_07550 [Alistipes sp.]|nr:hypothetical protein [Alistipes sp.]